MNLIKLAQSGWANASSELHKVADYVIAHTSSQTHDQINASLVAAKQGASDAISLADSVTGQVLESGSDDLVTMFNNGLQALGFALGGPAAGAAVTLAERFVEPYEIDAVHRFRDMLKAQLDSLSLSAIAHLAGIPATPAAKTEAVVIAAPPPLPPNGL